MGLLLQNLTCKAQVPLPGGTCGMDDSACEKAGEWRGEVAF